MYIHELDDWPRFHWSAETIAAPLASVRDRQTRLIRNMEALGFNLQQEAVLQTLTADVLKSSEIEGEKLDAAQVRSSIARRLGMDIGALKPADRNVEGVVEMMLDATRRYDQPLTAKRLFDWHAALFPTGRSGMTAITVGGWRDDRKGPMQVVSGPLGKEHVHYEAPKAERLEQEMKSFLEWFESDKPIDQVVAAGLAHLWFVTIHPFDDGNGRIARAIADMALARSEHSPRRFYSMSAQIRLERKAYYDILESTQKGSMDITPWMEWFLGCLGRAIDGAEETLGAVLDKKRFWDRFKDVKFNERQLIVINRVLDGFEGNLTTSKYAALAKCSQDTAHRDILALVDQGILVRNPEGGRSTSYSLAPSQEGKQAFMTKKNGPPRVDSASRLIDARIRELGDWRGEMLSRLRALIKQADRNIVEEWKWETPVWSHSGIVCTGETYKNVVKMTFAKGAALDDPSGLFNSSLEGRARRAIDFREGDKVSEKALKTLIRAAVALNTASD